jgi:hypothetical protein
VTTEAPEGLADDGEAAEGTEERVGALGGAPEHDAAATSTVAARTVIRRTSRSTIIRYQHAPVRRAAG